MQRDTFGEVDLSHIELGLELRARVLSLTEQEIAVSFCLPGAADAHIGLLDFHTFMDIPISYYPRPIPGKEVRVFCLGYDYAKSMPRFGFCEYAIIEIECYEGAGDSFLGTVRVRPDATVGQLKAHLSRKGWLPTASKYILLVGDRPIDPDDDYCDFIEAAEDRNQHFLLLRIVHVDLV